MSQHLHLNNGACPHCQVILNKFPGFHPSFRAWFEAFQKQHPEAHISDAGRGKAEQEAYVASGASDANWPDSAHNWNAALDFFCNHLGADIYNKDWFNTVLAPALPSWLVWYGKPGSPFREFPHVQIRNWRALRSSGALKLVEPLYPPKLDPVA